VGISEVFKNQTHLQPEERQQLYDIFLDFQSLFQGKWGEYNGAPIDLDLLPGSKPFYGKPFLNPKVYQQMTKDEIARLESIGLLTKVTNLLRMGRTHLHYPKEESNC